MDRSADDDAVLELRQYALLPGRRDELIELFDREFLESQDDLGGHVRGQFRDLDDPDCFVWLRSFADMTTRRAALEAFYGGPVWAAHRDAANATMLDSDDVLLLRPVPGRPVLRTDHLTRPVPDLGPAASGAAPDVPSTASGTAPAYGATVLALDEPAGGELVDLVIERIGQELLGLYVTEPAPNTFPALPVREGETVLVWFDRGAAVAWPDGDEDALAALGAKVVQRLRLAPTARSLLR
jgi:hypothetical protein